MERVSYKKNSVPNSQNTRSIAFIITKLLLGYRKIIAAYYKKKAYVIHKRMVWGKKMMRVGATGLSADNLTSTDVFTDWPSHALRN